MPTFSEVGYVFKGTTAEVAAFNPALANNDDGMFVQDTQAKIDYWIDPDGLTLIPRKAAGYAGFSFTDGTTTGDTIASGDSVTITGTSPLEATVAGSTVTVGIDGTALPAGHVIVGGAGDTFSVRAPLFIGAASTNYLTYNTATGELNATPTLVNSFTDSTAADLAAFVAAEYTAGNEFQVQDMISTADGALYLHNGGTSGGAADFTRINNPAAGIMSFSIAGNTGNATITDGQTITFGGGPGVTATVVGNTVNYNVSIGFANLNDVPANPGAGDHVLINNNGTLSYEDAVLTDNHLGANNLGTTSNRTFTVSSGHTLTWQLDTAATAVMSATGITMNEANIKFANAANGIIRTAPDGSEWLETMNNNGQLTRTRL